MCADRASYEARHAALLHALHSGDGPLLSFNDDDLAAASESLLRKRRGAVVDNWPALTNGLGSRFPTEYKRYAATKPPPAAGEGIADGLQFAQSLDRQLLSADARIEVLLASGQFRLRHGLCTPRRGAFFAATVVKQPRRLVIVVRLPRLRTTYFAFRIASER